MGQNSKVVCMPRSTFPIAQDVSSMASSFITVDKAHQMSYSQRKARGRQLAQISCRARRCS